MVEIDPRVDAYIRAAPDFARPILEKVRAAFHKGCPQAMETIKWSRPHFEHRGLLGSMSAFKAHVSFGFWRGAELEDPERILERTGNTGMFAVKVKSARELPSQRVLISYVKRATALNASGSPAPERKPARPPRPASRVPRDLDRALKAEPAALAAFRGFPPSGKREYVDWITSAKGDDTRARRVGQAVEWMAKGLRRNWKYERKS